MRALCSALFLGSLLMGCQHVRPYEREAMSRVAMDPKSESGETRFQSHVRESREGSTASSGAAGGGCGCN